MKVDQIKIDSQIKTISSFVVLNQSHSIISEFFNLENGFYKIVATFEK